jgi:hypothetical protein
MRVEFDREETTAAHPGRPCAAPPLRVARGSGNTDAVAGAIRYPPHVIFGSAVADKERQDKQRLGGSVDIGPPAYPRSHGT